jgi:hypothetical protein
MSKHQPAALEKEFELDLPQRKNISISAASI